MVNKNATSLSSWLVAGDAYAYRVDDCDQAHRPVFWLSDSVKLATETVIKRHRLECDKSLEFVP